MHLEAVLPPCMLSHIVSTKNMNPSSMCLEWLPIRPLVTPSDCSAVQPQTPAKGIPRSTYTAAIWALYGNTWWLCGSVTVSNGAFQMAGKPGCLVYIQGGQVSLYVLILHFNRLTPWIRCLSLCLIDELHGQFPDRGSLWCRAASGGTRWCLVRSDSCSTWEFYPGTRMSLTHQPCVRRV